ncbi:CapA family protein [Kocuria sp. cx-455]|uniref:CapA family protein n=1 Tax=Kocuria sp. cx-455 TaxID=2771377 RepID=UPI0016864751|nr:CapA family protein [Kocuria sp. cx-455]MBD2764544.1 CapA family protein [Kocuria sp. cx-455]
MSLPTSRHLKTLTFAAAVALMTGGLAGCADEAGETASSPSEGAPSTTGSDAFPTLPAAASGPECPEDQCMTMAVTGDLLLHEGLWRNFATDPAADNDKNFDFEPLLAGQRAYLENSDIGVCHAETPVAEKGGPYADYPQFQVPPEILTAVKTVGYDACTTASNHTLDQGTAGINRTLTALDDAGLQHTGSYASEAASEEPLLVHTEAGTVAIVTGTNSVNQMAAEHDWQVDRFRDGKDPTVDPEVARADIDRAVSQAEKAREQGADVVVAAMHSIVEYTDTADDYQVRTAHALADSGSFDAIYGHGSHSVQPIENYDGTWIVYGVGNTVTETAPMMPVNNDGLIARFQFAKAEDGSWDVSDLSWAPSSNTRGGQYAWCSAASDAPNGTCRSQAQDKQNRERLAEIVNTPSAVEHGLREWLVSEDGPAVP